MAHSTFVALGAWALLATSTAAQTPLGRFRELELPRHVWVVDAAGGGDFSDLPQAVRRAGPGDLVRVLPSASAYTGFRLEGKGLAIVGVGGAAVRVEGCVEIVGVPAGQQVLLKNLTLDVASTFCSFIPACQHYVDFRLEDNDGLVWMEDVSIVGNPGAYQDVLRVFECGAVVLIRCTAEVPAPVLVFENTPADMTLHARDSAVHAFESAFHGADGILAIRPLFIGGDPGGHAVALEGTSFLYASGCLFEGGDGGAGTCVFSTCLPPRDGGDGLVFLDASTARAVDPILVGGAAGAGTTCNGTPCTGSSPGSAISPAGFAGYQELPVPARTYRLEPPAPGSNTTLLTATGPVGDLVVTLGGTNPAAVYVPLHAGTQLVGAPLTVVVEGTIPAGGVLTKEVPLPRLPPLLEFVIEYRQGFFFDPGNQAFLASGSALVLVR